MVNFCVQLSMFYFKKLKITHFNMFIINHIFVQKASDAG